jgi:prepilin-type N-terminal cleavage/methylation domain-containing protein
MNMRREFRRGFTLVELLVVVLIVVLVSAATLPVVIPAITHRQVSEAARILQASIAGARDAAIRTNAPRGIRLLPDPAFPGPSPLAANRMISIEAAPDYTSGMVTINPPATPTLVDPISGNSFPVTMLRIHESIFDANGLPNEPTSWYWNIRQGDRIRLDDSGRYYTVVGPMLNGIGSGNSERYINFGAPGYVDDGSSNSVQNNPDPLSARHYPEYLIVVNGQDDNGNGWVDEAFDGIDNDGDGVIDPGFDGINNNLAYNNAGEYEPEKFIGNQFATITTATPLANQKYTIFRRPMVSESAREVALPQGVVIDLTTWNAATAVTINGTPAGGLPERSRLPVDPYTYYVDILLSPNGQVLLGGAGQGTSGGGGANSPVSSMPFYHFWLSEREDVYDTLWTSNSAPNTGTPNFLPYANPYLASNPRLPYLLPMPQGTPFYPPPNTNLPFLKGDRRLVTLFVKSGLVVTNEVETFDGSDINLPYYQPQLGTRQSQ